jgi:hypothetical protein
MRLPVIALLLLTIPGVALAEAPKPYTIDMTTVLKDLKGAPIPDSSQAVSVPGPDGKPTMDCSKCGPLTLGDVVASALLMDRRDEPNLSTIDKAKRGYLAEKILGNKAVTLTGPQVTEIEKLLSAWPPLIVNDALPLIDPAEAAKLAD